MIRTEAISYIPPLDWTEYSAFELRTYSEEARRELVRGSRQIKIVYEDRKPLLIAGLYKGSLISTPYLWALLTPDFRALRVSSFRTLIHELSLYASVMETLIDESNPGSVRLAKLFSFFPTSSEAVVEDRPCRMYRRTR